MNHDDIIKHVEEFAAENLGNHDGGHDFWHLSRVRNTALYLLNTEGYGDHLLVEISALLHDIGDSKFKKDTDSEAGSLIADLLGSLRLDDKIIKEVVFINHNISFSKGKRPAGVSKEFMIVQDADRLDAIGAIGIARAFNYGGFRNSMIYDPEGNRPSTIAHFNEKLLKLKELMNTATGKRVAEERHEYLELFLRQFFREWDLAAK
jgi:uncharacterized protein